MKTYIIRAGCSFRVSDTKVLHGGDRIELEDDVAELHRDKVEPAPADDQTSAQAGDGVSPD